MLNKLGYLKDFMFKKLSLKLCIIFSVAILVGCTSIGVSDLFFGYSQQMKQSRSAQLRGEFVEFISEIQSQKSIF